MARTIDFDRYVAACNYPGVLDEQVVTQQLQAYLAALNVTRGVRRLPVDWDLATEAPLRRSVGLILDDLAKRAGWPADARDALDAQDALDARAAQDALDALDARAALDALDARAARDAQAALDARAALDALDARDARDAQAALDARAARAALAALDAQDALDARAAQDALDARAALDALDALDARDARDARAAQDARDARAALAALDIHGALRRFTSWCLHRGSWFWWGWELSWIATTLIGAQQLGKNLPWARPLFEAYVAGAWFLYWTEDTLYWVAKPVVHVECDDTVGLRRLHCDNGPAIESDAENLYFVHGVMVPAFVVVRPDWITVQHIQQEENAEVRRVMLERYGFDRFVIDSGAQPQSTDAYGTLYRIELPNDEPLVIVRVKNSTPEPNGNSKFYTLRVPPDTKTAHAAVAWSFGMKPSEYAPAIET